jgi:hypothetical protein
MSELFLQSVAAVVTATLGFYLVTVSFQIGSLVNDGIRVRAIPPIPVLAALWQNIGLGCAILGLLYGDTQLMIFGGMFVALRTMLQPLRAPSWIETIEQPLLIMALISLALLAATRIAAYPSW